MAGEITKALSFMRAIGADPEQLHTVELFASHEALLLDYETALTRIDSRTGLPAVSGHLLWVGERTRDLGGAHVEFAARVRNPVAVKLGPTASPEDVLALAERLDPDREPGRLSFVSRMGARRVRDELPPLVEKATASGLAVSWICDPMHGNTYEAPSGHKTRRFDDVVDEVRGFFEVHRSLGTVPGGIHVELTGDDVTECVGGGDPIGGRSSRPLRDLLRSPPEPHPVAGACLPRRRAARGAFRHADMTLRRDLGRRPALLQSCRGDRPA